MANEIMSSMLKGAATGAAIGYAADIINLLKSINEKLDNIGNQSNDEIIPDGPQIIHAEEEIPKYDIYAYCVCYGFKPKFVDGCYYDQLIKDKSNELFYKHILEFDPIIAGHLLKYLPITNFGSFYVSGNSSHALDRFMRIAPSKFRYRNACAQFWPVIFKRNKKLDEIVYERTFRYEPGYEIYAYSTYNNEITESPAVFDDGYIYGRLSDYAKHPELIAAALGLHHNLDHNLMVDLAGAMGYEE